MDDVTEIRSVLTNRYIFKISQVTVTFSLRFVVTPRSPLKPEAFVNESLCELGKSDEFLFFLSQAARFNKVACARLASMNT